MLVSEQDYVGSQVGVWKSRNKGPPNQQFLLLLWKNAYVAPFSCPCKANTCDCRGFLQKPVCVPIFTTVGIFGPIYYILVYVRSPEKVKGWIDYLLRVEGEGNGFGCVNISGSVMLAGACEASVYVMTLYRVVS